MRPDNARNETQGEHFRLCKKGKSLAGNGLTKAIPQIIPHVGGPSKTYLSKYAVLASVFVTRRETNSLHPILPAKEKHLRMSQRLDQ